MPVGRLEAGFDLFLFRCLAGFFDDAGCVVEVVRVRVDGFCLRPGRTGCGDELDVELLVVVDDDDDEDEDEDEGEVEVVDVEDDVGLDELDVVVLDVVLVGLVVVLLAGAQVSLSDTTVPEIGKFRLEIGVPGVMLTLKVYVCPPRTVTVIVHASADAIGEATIAIAISAVPTTANNNNNLPLSGTCQLSPIPEQVVIRRGAGDGNGVYGKLLTGLKLCNAELSLAGDRKPTIR